MTLMGLLKLYQGTLSPDHGPLRHLYPYGFCRHHPTCSQFAIEQLESRALPIAIFSIMKRLSSCHPWREPGNEKLQLLVEKLAEAPAQMQK